jgi:ribosome-binding factor A
VLGGPEKREDARRAFERARGYFQKDVGKDLTLRYTPHLEFELDDTADKAKEVEQVIKIIHEKNEG